MITRTIEDFMRDTYDSLVDYRYSTNNFDIDEGIHFIIEIVGDNYGFEKDGNTYHEEWESHIVLNVHYIFLSRHMVFRCITDSDKLNGIEQWDNLSNHDTKYALNLDLSWIMVEMYEDIYYKTPKEHRPELKDQSINFNIGGRFNKKPFTFVKVDLKNNTKDADRKIISNVRTIKKTITI